MGSSFCSNHSPSRSDKKQHSHVGYIANQKELWVLKGLLPDQDESTGYLLSRDLLMLSGHPNRHIRRRLTILLTIDNGSCLRIDTLL